MKKENGNGLLMGFLTFFILVFVALFFIGLFSLRLDFASGSHRITPTAIDNDIWGNYKVYYKTSEYTKNSDEDYYYIDKDNLELVEQMKDVIKNGKTVIAYYEKYVGFKGLTAPDSSPIIKIEVIENN